MRRNVLAYSIFHTAYAFADFCDLLLTETFYNAWSAAVASPNLAAETWRAPSLKEELFRPAHPLALATSKIARQ